MEQHEVAHEGVDAGIGEVVAGRGDEDDFMTLFVPRRIHADAGDGLDVVAEEFHDFTHGMGLDAEVVAGAVAVVDRVHDPVDAETEVEQHLAHDDRDFRGVDAVGAEQGAAAAFGALVEVDEPLLDDVLVELAGSGELAEQTACGGEVLAVHGAQKFGAQHGHVLGIVGAEEEVALVGAGAAAHAAVHEHLEGTMLVQRVLQGVVKDLLPVFGQFPVLVVGSPVVGVLEAEAFQYFRLGGIAEAAGMKIRLGVHPSLFGEGSGRGRQQFFGCGHFCHDQ